MARIVFMGTPDFAVPTLEALIAHHTVIGVITQPDRPAGRKGELKAPPVKDVAIAHGLPLQQPEKLRAKSAIANLASLGEADLYIVAAFGQILPQAVLDLPKKGCINVHGSLLPRWRGAAPIQAAIRAGDAQTGVTIMMMDAGLDTGDMLTKRAIPIVATTTAQSLHDEMAIVGAQLLIETLPRVLDGTIIPESQDETLVTVAPQIQKEDGHIQWDEPADSIERLIRAFTPWPSAFTFWENRQLKLFRAQVMDGMLPIGTVGIVNGSVAIGTAQGVLCPQEVQLEGKKRVSITEFIHGYPQIVGTQLA